MILGNKNRNIGPAKGFVAANGMTKRANLLHLSRNQVKILDILTQYEELTARDIAEILWARDISYRTAEYSSTSRSLRTLYRKGLVTKAGGKIKWRKTQNTISR